MDFAASSICNFRVDLILQISLTLRVLSFKFMRFWANAWLFLMIFSFKIFAFIKFPGDFSFHSKDSTRILENTGINMPFLNHFFSDEPIFANF